MSEHTPTAASAPPTVNHHARCINCNYPLLGLPRDGACPECGLPLAASLERTLASVLGKRGRRLLQQGTGCLEASAGLYAIGVCIPFVVHLIPLLWAIGAFLLSRIDPPIPLGGDSAPSRASLRRSAIALGVVGVICPFALIAAPTMSFGVQAGPASGIASTIIIAIACAQAVVLGWSVLASARVLAAMAVHLPSPAAVRKLRRARWAAPVWMVGLASYLVLTYGYVFTDLRGLPSGPLTLLTVIGWGAVIFILDALSRWRIDVYRHL